MRVGRGRQDAPDTVGVDKAEFVLPNASSDSAIPGMYMISSFLARSVSRVAVRETAIALELALRLWLLRYCLLQARP